MSRLTAYPLTRRWALALTLTLVPGVVPAQPTTTRVSVGSGGVEGNGSSYGSAISADGRWVVFGSGASNLVAGDTNDRSDVFVLDQLTATTTRVTVGPGGAQGDGDSYGSAISSDGRWLVFHSNAGNLVAGDTNGMTDVFVHDRQTASTTRVSQGPGDVQANGASYVSAISDDGRWVVFSSEASNLVAGDTNASADAFVHDRQTGMTTRVSVGPGGAQGNSSSFGASVSVDGRWVAFQSDASNLVTGDTNGSTDAFVHDQQTSTTTRVSVGPGGAQGNGTSNGGAISADGRWVAFSSEASNLVSGDTNGQWDAFVYDRQTETVTRVSVGPGGAQGNGHSLHSAISADGRWVAFGSFANDLVVGDTNDRGDAFVHDQQTQTTARTSLGRGGAQGNGHSSAASMSGDGRWVTFYSMANNLVAADTNGQWDAFAYDRVDPECWVALAPSSASAPAAGATGSVQVTAPATCGWTAVSNDPTWLTVTAGASGTGGGTVNYNTAANTGAPRTGSISIWGQDLTVHQVSATHPEAPTGLVAHSVVGNVVTLRWTPPVSGPTATNFVVEGGIAPGQVLASLPTGSGAPTFTFTAPSGSFFVRMHALNGTYRSAASNEIPIHVNAPLAPSAPATLLGLVNGSTLALAWTNTYDGGAPTSLVLDVTGAITTSVPLGLTDSFRFAGVPPGTYTFTVLARNSAGGTSSNPVTLTFPGPCSGAPDAPVSVVAYAVGRTVFVDWSPAVTGLAPTSYVLNVTGSFVGGFPTTTRALSGTVGPGSYTLRVAAVNACGTSAGTAPITIVVP